MIKSRSSLPEWFFVHQVIGKMAVEFEEAFLIFCQSYVLLSAAIAEINTDDRVNPYTLSCPNERKYSCGTIDVCEGKCIQMSALCLIDERIYGQGAVLKAEVRVTVDKHIFNIRCAEIRFWRNRVAVLLRYTFLPLAGSRRDRDSFFVRDTALLR